MKDLQTRLPWTTHYSTDFRSNPQSHKDFAHAIIHVGKALGHLYGLVDDMDHDRTVVDRPGIREQYEKYIADIVISALRAANVFPGGVIDLERAVIERIENKNPGVRL